MSPYRFLFIKNWKEDKFKIVNWQTLLKWVKIFKKPRCLKLNMIASKKKGTRIAIRGGFQKNKKHKKKKNQNKTLEGLDGRKK